MKSLIIGSCVFWAMAIWAPRDLSSLRTLVNKTEPEITLKLCQNEGQEYVVGDYPDNAPDFVKKARQAYPFYSPCFKALKIEGHTKLKQFICNLLFARDVGGYVWDFNNTIIGVSERSVEMDSAIQRVNKHLDDGFTPTIEFVAAQVDC